MRSEECTLGHDHRRCGRSIPYIGDYIDADRCDCFCHTAIDAAAGTPGQHAWAPADPQPGDPIIIDGRTYTLIAIDPNGTWRLRTT